MRDFDVVFIGSGHSCWHGALTLVQAGDKKISAKYIVIGTGQRNARLDIPGKEFLHGSRTFLDIEVL